MTANEVTIACCQVALHVGHVDENRTVLACAVDEAAAAGAGIVVLPELAATGYRLRDRDELAWLAEPMDGPTVAEWVGFAARHDIILVGGLIEAASDGRHYNSAVLVDSTGVHATYRKAHLWDEEPRWFVPGDGPPPVVETRYGRVGVMVCYDLEFPEWTRMAALDGAQLLCAPVNWPRFSWPAGERPNEIVKVQAAAAANRVYVAVCDRTNEERGAPWLGGSVVIDPDGYPLTEIALGRPTTVTARVDMDVAADKRVGDRNDVFADRRTELYRLDRNTTA